MNRIIYIQNHNKYNLKSNYRKGIIAYLIFLLCSIIFIGNFGCIKSNMNINKLNGNWRSTIQMTELGQMITEMTFNNSNQLIITAIIYQKGSWPEENTISSEYIDCANKIYSKLWRSPVSYKFDNNDLLITGNHQQLRLRRVRKYDILDIAGEWIGTYTESTEHQTKLSLIFKHDGTVIRKIMEDNDGKTIITRGKYRIKNDSIIFNEIEWPRKLLINKKQLYWPNLVDKSIAMKKVTTSE